MSNFKHGDKVRLTEEAFDVLSKPANRAEAESVLGVLTVASACSWPSDEDPQGQAVWFEEIPDTIPSECLKRI